MKLLILAALAAIAQPNAEAKLSVVTTTTDLKALATEIGGDLISVESIAKGTQDPHYIEAKPSFMTKVSKADLVLAIGLDLEIGWLPSLLNGARNPNVREGSKGYLELGQTIQTLEVPSGKISRADGDVHPYGNPHFTLDPIRAAEAGLKLAAKLAELDGAHSKAFEARALAFQSRMAARTKEWQARVKKSGIKSAVTYHKTLTYFLDRFGIENPMILEPKPGIPPTSGHLLEVINAIKTKKIPLVLIENFFDPSVTKKIEEAVPGIRKAVVPVSVDGAEGTATLEALYEKLVSTIEGKSK